MHKNTDDKLLLALLDCTEEKRKRETRSRLSLFSVLFLGVVFGVFSFFLYKGDESGELSAATGFFEEVLEENEALAVFLGLSED